jgi:hypothetical protein
VADQTVEPVHTGALQIGGALGLLRHSLVDGREQLDHEVRDRCRDHDRDGNPADDLPPPRPLYVGGPARFLTALGVGFACALGGGAALGLLRQDRLGAAVEARRR